MWLVDNLTPYAADRGWVGDRDANKIWLVVVKATFDLPVRGAPRLSKEQQPVRLLSEPRGEPGASSLRYDSDLLGVKPGTDVIVDGSAWAARGRRVLVADVLLKVGPVHKSLRVFGERRWKRGVVQPVISDAEPFESMPVTFERAYGGWDRSASDPAEHRLEMRNPVGTGYATTAAHAVGKALPNVEDPRRLIAFWDERPMPAGLSCVSWDWSPRRELAGTYDERWLADRAPLWATDFDPRYHQSAPADQQVAGHLRGGEVVELHGMSPDGPIVFELPHIELSCETHFGSEAVRHDAQLATVTIEPDLRRLTMAWQASLKCNRRIDQLDATTVRLRAIR